MLVERMLPTHDASSRNLRTERKRRSGLAVLARMTNAVVIGWSHTHTNIKPCFCFHLSQKNNQPCIKDINNQYCFFLQLTVLLDWWFDHHDEHCH